jgi:ABC-type branched-subunit amino acid transport system substrate-binding protein
MKRMLVIATVLLTAACGSTVSPAARRAAGGSTARGDLGAGTGTQSGDSSVPGDAGATGAVGAANGATQAGGRSAATVAGRAGTSSAATGGGAAAAGPIELGFVRTGTSNAAAYGASLGNSVTETQVDDALVAAFNDQGGIAGRRIAPVYADTDTGSTSWDADFEAACAKLTQDHKVAAVLGYVFNHDPAFEACLAKRAVPHLSTTFNVPDVEELRNYPLLMALATPRIERRSQEKIDGAVATGVVTKTSKLGIVIDSCPGTERAWTKSTKPYIQSKGLTITSTFQIGCAHGSGDAAAAAGQAGNLVLQFRTAGVDRVMVDAVSEGPAILILGNAAEAQSWHPWYVVSSLANAAVIGGQMPADQAANIHGYGWMPAQDVNPPQWPGTNAAQQHCIAMLKQKGVTLKAAVDYLYAFNLCDALFIYEIALKTTHGRTDGPAVVAAVEALGSTYVSALNLDGRDTFSHSQHDAPSVARYFAWDTGCSCFTYRSTMFPIA